MQIKSTLTNRSGQVLDVIYNDLNDESELGNRKINGVHAYCFYEGKLVIVYADKKKYWSPPGGAVEIGESVQEEVIREVKEETNMKVVYQKIIGYQEVDEINKTSVQTRSFCIVEPYGPFVSDPDGDITEIKLIDPNDYKNYFDWGKIGDHIFNRAMEIMKKL